MKLTNIDAVKVKQPQNRRVLINAQVAPGMEVLAKLFMMKS